MTNLEKEHLHLNIFFRANADTLVGRLQYDLSNGVSVNTERTLDLSDIVRDLPAYLNRLDDKVPRRAGDHAVWFQQMGSRLFERLFAQDWNAYFDEAQGYARADGRVLQVNICAENHPQTDEIPWELMYDARENRYIGCEQQSIIIRRTEQFHSQARSIAEPGEPIRLTLAESNIWEQSGTHGDEEIREIQTLLKKRLPGRVHFTVLQNASWSELEEHLLQTQSPHVLHLIAHGDESGILFRDGNDTRRIAYRAIHNTLADAKGLRLAIFNVCNSNKILLRRRVDMPPQLPSATGIWAVIAPRATISPRGAFEFATSLYRILSTGRTLSQAVGYTRSSAIDQTRLVKGSEVHELPEWSIPMIYEASNILVFPPLAQLKRVTARTPLNVSQLTEIQRQMTLLATSISSLTDEWANAPIINSWFVDQSGEPLRLVGDILSDLGAMDWEKGLDAWFNEACNLAETISDELERFQRQITSLQGLRVKSPDYLIYRSKALQALQNANTNGQDLVDHFAQLLTPRLRATG